MPNPKDYTDLPTCSGCKKQHPTPEWAEKHPEEAKRWIAEDRAETLAARSPEQREIDEAITRKQSNANRALDMLMEANKALMGQGLNLLRRKHLALSAKPENTEELELIEAESEQLKRQRRAVELNAAMVMPESCDWVVMSMNLARESENAQREGQSLLHHRLIARKKPITDENPEGWEFVVVSWSANEAKLDAAMTATDMDAISDSIYYVSISAPKKHTMQEANNYYMAKCAEVGCASIDEGKLAKFVVLAHPSRDKLIGDFPGLAATIQCGEDVLDLVANFKDEETNEELITANCASYHVVSAFVLGRGDENSSSDPSWKAGRGVVHSKTDLLEASVDDMMAMAHGEGATRIEGALTEETIA